MTFPIRHPNTVLESISEKYFKKHLPESWIAEKPTDYGIDWIISLVKNNCVVGLNFSVQLKAKHNIQGKPAIRLKKSTLNYLFNRLEPGMIVLYDQRTEVAYWKWLHPADFDLSGEAGSFKVQFSSEQTLSSIDWEEVYQYVQKVFKVKNHLLTSLEYDLFNTSSEAEIKAWSHYFARNHDEAAFYFKRLVEQNAKPIWLQALAQCLYQVMDYRNAIIYINQALETDQSDEILLTKGSILAEDGIRTKDNRKLSEAEKVFSALYEKKANALNAYNYANTIYNLKKNEEAIKLYRHALALNPNYAEAWKNLGQVYYAIRRHDLEMECYNNALKINPELMQAKVSRAVTLGSIYEQYNNAIQILLECVETDKSLFAEFSAIYYWIGFFYARTGKINDALNWVNKGLDNNPGDSYLLNFKANFLYEILDSRQDLIDEALSFYSQNHQLNGNDALNLYFLCTALDKKGDKDKALDMAASWLKARLFITLDDVSVKLLTLNEALAIIREWELIQEYVVRYSNENIRYQLKNSGLTDIDDFLLQLELKRLLFIAFIADLFLRNHRAEVTSDSIFKIYESTLLSVDVVTISKFITAHKEDNAEAFRHQFATALLVTAEMCVQEFVRCVAWVDGYANPDKDIKEFGERADASLFQDTLLSYAEKLYACFGLPMG